MNQLYSQSAHAISGHIGVAGNELYRFKSPFGGGSTDGGLSFHGVFVMDIR